MGLKQSVSAALLRETALQMANLIDLMGGISEELLPGYRVKILDGNCLEGTDRRLEAIRNLGAKALPGKSLVVLDPQLRLAIDIFLCEDGHAQERSLFEAVLETVKADELWIADRNMCTLKFLLGISKKGANFVIREHKNLPWQAVNELLSSWGGRNR